MTVRPGRGLLDTSVLIAAESGRALDAERLPDEVAVSAVTVTELHVGVLAASEVETRARRLATLESISDVEILGIDVAVAAAWARLRMQLAQSGRRLNVNDLWIAATAVANGIPVITQDDDFDPVDGAAGLTVVRV